MDEIAIGECETPIFWRGEMKGEGAFVGGSRSSSVSARGESRRITPQLCYSSLPAPGASTHLQYCFQTASCIRSKRPDYILYCVASRAFSFFLAPHPYLARVGLRKCRSNHFLHSSSLCESIIPCLPVCLFFTSFENDRFVGITLSKLSWRMQSGA